MNVFIIILCVLFGVLILRIFLEFLTMDITDFFIPLLRLHPKFIIAKLLIEKTLKTAEMAQVPKEIWIELHRIGENIIRFEGVYDYKKGKLKVFNVKFDREICCQDKLSILLSKKNIYNQKIENLFLAEKIKEIQKGNKKLEKYKIEIEI